MVNLDEIGNNGQSVRENIVKTFGDWEEIDRTADQLEVKWDFTGWGLGIYRGFVEIDEAGDFDGWMVEEELFAPPAPELFFTIQIWALLLDGQKWVVRSHWREWHKREVVFAGFSPHRVLYVEFARGGSLFSLAIAPSGRVVETCILWEEKETCSYLVDVPGEVGEDWKFVKSFDSRADAIAFCQEEYGSDDNGCVSLICEGIYDLRI